MTAGLRPASPLREAGPLRWRPQARADRRSLLDAQELEPRPETVKQLPEPDDQA